MKTNRIRISGSEIVGMIEEIVGTIEATPYHGDGKSAPGVDVTVRFSGGVTVYLRLTRDQAVTLADEVRVSAAVLTRPSGGDAE